MLLVGVVLAAFVGFLVLALVTRDTCDPVCYTSVYFAVIASLILIVAVLALILLNTGVEARLEAEKMRYESLVSQAENHLYDSDNNIGKKELADEIREWNEDLAKYKKMKEDIWLKDFYPMKVDELKFIPNDILK